MSKKKKSIQYESFNIEDYINMETFQESVILFFKDVPNPRAPDNCDYLLSDLLIIMLMAVISGADDVADLNSRHRPL